MNNELRVANSPRGSTGKAKHYKQSKTVMFEEFHVKGIENIFSETHHEKI